MAVDLANEKKYLESVMAKGGGAATWAQNQAKQYGITLGQPSAPSASSTGSTSLTSGTGQPATANAQGQVTSNAGIKPAVDSTSLTSGTGSPAGVTFTPNTTAPNLNQSQLAYFDKNFGGIDNYAKTQNERYAAALDSRDQEAINKFNADSQRVGYSLDPQKYSQNKQMLQPDYSWIDTFVNNELDQQRLALDQQLARHMGDASNVVNQNNMFLSEQLGRLDQQKRQREQDIINFNNRRGNFYSGGLDYQLASNERSYSEATDNVTRDISARNSEIWGRYGTLAEQAYEKIALLQQQAPDRIRQLIQEQMERDAQFTGYYNGAPTMQMQNQQFNQDMATREFDLARANQEWQQNFAQGQFDFNKAQTIWENTFKEKSFQQSMNEAAASRGYQWASLNQREREFIADLAFKEKQLEFEMNKGQSKVDIAAEEEGLVEAIRGGQLTPGQALQRIEQDYQRGYYNITEANRLKGVLSLLAPSTQSGQVASDPAVQDFLTRIPSDAEIEAEARRLGYPTIDYRSYYKDPNGKMAGLTFEQWKSLYGPRITAR